MCHHVLLCCMRKNYSFENQKRLNFYDEHNSFDFNKRKKHEHNCFKLKKSINFIDYCAICREWNEHGN